MTAHARPEDDTVPIGRVAEDTLELPVVEPPIEAVRAEPPTPLPAAPPAAPRRRGLVGIAVVVVLVALVATVGAALGLRQRRGSPSGGSGAVLPVRAVTSVDPSDGSGFARAGATWRTQSYRSAAFGNLKPGVGLLLDLGKAERVSSVRVTVTGSGTTLSLRGGDSAGAAPGGFRTVATESDASGATTLRASSTQAHRYWLLWVSRLGTDGGSYRTVLRGFSVRG